jgi:hypothetical protein
MAQEQLVVMVVLDILHLLQEAQFIILAAGAVALQIMERLDQVALAAVAVGEQALVQMERQEAQILEEAEVVLGLLTHLLQQVKMEVLA